MRLSKVSSLFIATLALILCVDSFAQVPQIVSYRGQLVDASGAPVVDGANFLRFVIYDSVSGGAELWNSGIQQVPTSGGLFTYQLGSNTPFTVGLFRNSAALFLGITVGADPEITPRTMFTSSAFALQAEHASTAETATTAKNALLLDGEPASAYLSPDWNALMNVPRGFADGVDNDAGGDITEVLVGEGMIGGGISGQIEIGIAVGGITSSHIADNAVSPGKILAEPGVAQRIIASQKGMPTDLLVVLDSQTIDVPAAGYVLVMATCDVEVTQVSGTTTWLEFGISQSATSYAPGPARRWQIDHSAPQQSRHDIIQTQRIFAVSSAGSQSFYFLGFNKLSAFLLPQVSKVTLTLAYFPTAYGSLSAGP